MLVFYAGELVESGPTSQVLAHPRHPYTEALLRVASVGDWQRRELEVIPGRRPPRARRCPGCRFAPAARSPRTAAAGAVPLTDLGDGALRPLRPRDEPADDLQPSPSVQAVSA